jgi:hypothetical protein
MQHRWPDIRSATTPETDMDQLASTAPACRKKPLAA